MFGAAQDVWLAQWHRCVHERDMTVLASLIHPDAVFRSPMAHTPYPGGMAVVFALKNVTEVFENFTYHREIFAKDGRSVFLEFTAEIDGKSLKGMDLISFDEEGLITEFEVMIRPMSGLTALAEKMAPRMAKMIKPS